MLLRRGQDEHGVLRRLLQCLQKGIEGILGQHVYLVNDIHLVLAILRRDSNLVDDAPDVLYPIVRGGVEFEDVEAPLSLLGGEPIDGVGENPRTGRFADATGTAEEVSLRDLSRLDAVPQGVGDGLLAHHRLPCGGTVFACGDEEVVSFGHRVKGAACP